MRMAFFSDIHANMPALEAVLADVASIGVDARYVLGDLVGYAPWPNEVLERLQAEGIPGVMGNYDEGTGFDLTNAAAPTPTRTRSPSATVVRLDQGACQRRQQGVAAIAPREIRFEADGLRLPPRPRVAPPDQRIPVRGQARRTFARIAAERTPT